MTPGVVQADAAIRLGRYSHGQDHEAAIALLATVDKAAAGNLRTLLSMKTLTGYSHQPVSQDRALRAGRAMDALMKAARAAR